MPEFNMDIPLLRQLTAKTLRRTHEAKIFELRRMQSMRQRLNILAQVGEVLAGSSNVIQYTKPGVRSMRILSFQLNAHECDPLPDVIMQFPCNPCAFFFVGLDQSAPHAGQSVLGQLSFGDVEGRSDIASKTAVRVESRQAGVKDPPVLSIMTPQPVLHLKRLPPVEGQTVSVHAALQIVRVDSFCPSIPEFCFKRPS